MNYRRDLILKAVESILLVIAGSSAGTKDYTVKLIRELGEVVVHGVAMKPGKPTILGIINNKPVIGIPGYPVSAYLVFDTFVKPLINKYIGIKEIEDELIEARISRRIVSSLKNEERVRVNLGYVNDKLIATPLSSGAGVTMSLMKGRWNRHYSTKYRRYRSRRYNKCRIIKTIISYKEYFSFYR